MEEFHFFGTSFVTLFTTVYIINGICLGVLFKNKFNESPIKAFIPLYNQWILSQKIFGNNRGWVFLISFAPVIGAIYSIYFIYKFIKVFNRPGWVVLPFLIFGPLVYLYFALTDVEYSGPTRHILLD